MAKNSKKKGVSLAKGPVGLIGLILLAYGITAFILGGHSFRMDPVSGTVNGKSWLGIEVNAWSSLLFIGAGALLLFGSPMHWAAKSLSLVVGLALGAASVIALYDKNDVFGIFAANGPTAGAWGAAGTLLILFSLLPRVGGQRDDRQATTGKRQPRPSDEDLAGREPPREPVRVTRDNTMVGRDANGAARDSEAIGPGAGVSAAAREPTHRS